MNTRHSAAALALLAACSAVQAFDNKWSGFGSVVGGRTFGACAPEVNMSTKYDGYCTRYVADWGHAGVYKPEWSFSPESKVGLQWTGNFNDSFSATVQVMGRLNDGANAALEWAYLSYKINSSWTVQLGRKRLPLYYFSDFQDLGYAYPMMRPSPDVYGWDIVNYNGASIDYSTDFGDWSLRWNLYAGQEDSRKNSLYKIFYNVPIDIKWKSIVGSWVEVSRDWFTMRLAYSQSKVEQFDHDSGTQMQLPSGVYTGKQSFYGIALIADYQDWIARSEIAAADRVQLGYRGRFFYFAGGHRFGQFTPMLSYGQYRDASTVGDLYIPLLNRTLSASLRYELNKSSDLKVQFDRAMDKAAIPFAGSANAITVSYDFVF